MKTSDAGVRNRNGSGIHPGFIYLKGAAGAVTLKNVRFYDTSNRQILDGIGGSPIDLNLTTSYKSLEELVTGLSADAWNSIESAVAGIVADSLAGEVHAAYGSADAVVPTLKLAEGRPLSLGSGVPDEARGLAGATVNIDGRVQVDSRADTVGPLTLSVVGASGVITGGTNFATGTVYVAPSAKGMNSILVTPVTLGGLAGVTLVIEGTQDGVSWTTLAGKSYARANSLPNDAANPITFSGTTTEALYVGVGYQTYRVRASGVSGTGSAEFTVSVSSSPIEAYISTSAGQAAIRGLNTHDAAAVSALIQVGLEARSNEGTVVGGGDASRFLGTLAGHLSTWAGNPPGSDHWGYSTKGTALTANGNTPIAAAVVGKRNYVHFVNVVNGAAGSGDVSIEDSDGVVLWGPFPFDGDGPVAGMCPPFPAPFEPLDGTTRGAANRALRLKLANVSGTVAIHATVRGIASAL